MDVDLVPGALGCVVAEESINGLSFVVIDTIVSNAQPQLAKGDVLVSVNGSEITGRGMGCVRAR